MGAKTILDDQPGAYEAVRQLLGHKNLKTTTWFYAGLDTRRAGLHHQRLIDAEIAQRQLYRPGRKRRVKNDFEGEA